MTSLNSVTYLSGNDFLLKQPFRQLHLVLRHYYHELEPTDHEEICKLLPGINIIALWQNAGPRRKEIIVPIVEYIYRILLESEVSSPPGDNRSCLYLSDFVAFIGIIGEIYDR